MSGVVSHELIDRKVTKNAVQDLHTFQGTMLDVALIFDISRKGYLRLLWEICKQSEVSKGETKRITVNAVWGGCVV